MTLLEIIKQPWPWYVAGPLVGLTVPILLLLGNKHFGISANLRHACAICLPKNIAFFQYDWKKEKWNLFFVLGILIGSFLTYSFLSNPNPIQIHPDLKAELMSYGINDISGMLPESIFSWNELFTIKGFLIIALGGFLIGFGSRYAGGCTSGHAISGLSNLQLPSLIATCCFFIGGLLMANFILPYILSL
ncbi:YeeE/YedE family protein [Flavobacterium capsici]|uniref:YeeE/YedE thiosulfate transporter family protein n=1 Tax=Flavobacterium capsici TaxID=3075618 RepID=A0AA96F6G6_9FLAO|nr:MULTISPECIES: YeeE/YedE thiosulfate transporter family protein [unclassified Flavobacterium]WNM18565.1 YeeE/YedE thiosulfate transporter family protein [Flavobacterium sp. PMR2A8]WNM22616.1 YeeE/YedE thiosulfate transporter family protein [Flavobacterium sp. PMTSA4]